MRLQYDTRGWLMLACELECRATLLGISGYTQRNVMRLDTHKVLLKTSEVPPSGSGTDIGSILVEKGLHGE